MKPTLTALCIGIALTVPANGQIAKSGSGYLFRLKYKAKQHIVYDVTTEAKYAGAKEPVKVLYAMIVDATSASKNEFALKIGVTASKVYIGKQLANKEQTKATTIFATVDSKNRVLRSSAPEGAAPDLIDLEYPEKPIAPGFTWETGSVGNLMALGSVSARATYKFVGIKKVDGISVAVIGVTLKGTQSSTLAEGSGTILLRTSDGTFQSNEMNLRARPTGAATAGLDRIDITLKLTRRKGT